MPQSCPKILKSIKIVTFKFFLRLYAKKNNGKLFVFRYSYILEKMMS